MSYDAQCEALARVFVEDAPHLEANSERYIELLADDIQSTIELTIGYWEDHPVEREPEP